MKRCQGIIRTRWLGDTQYVQCCRTEGHPRFPRSLDEGHGVLSRSIDKDDENEYDIDAEEVLDFAGIVERGTLEYASAAKLIGLKDEIEKEGGEN